MVLFAATENLNRISWQLMGERRKRVINNCTPFLTHKNADPPYTNEHLTHISTSYFYEFLASLILRFIKSVIKSTSFTSSFTKKLINSKYNNYIKFKHI
jgi:hypothetical protein